MCGERKKIKGELKMTNRFSRMSSRSEGKDSTAKSGGDVKYNVIKSERIDWDPNNFLEISHKSYDAKGENAGSGEFYSLSRGYYATGNGDVDEGTPIYQKSLTLPADDTFLDSFISALDKILS